MIEGHIYNRAVSDRSPESGESSDVSFLAVKQMQPCSGSVALRRHWIATSLPLLVFALASGTQVLKQGLQIFKLTLD